MNKLSRSALVLPLLGSLCGFTGQYTIPMVTGANAQATGCTLPTGSWTNLWQPNASAGSSGFAGFNDASSTNNATAASSGAAPAYSATSGPNSKPGLTFNGSSNILGLASTIPASGDYTFFAVFNVASLSANQYLLGPSSTAGTAWRLASSSGDQQLVSVGITTIGSDTTGHSTNTWEAIAVTFVFATKAYAFYNYAGSGSWSAGASGTGVAAPTAVVASLGGSSPSSGFWNGNLALMGFYSGAPYTASGLNTAIGSYINCEYGF